MHSSSVDKHPVCIEAEIGSGHNGSRERARDLIQAALDSGADLVKFQHFYADEIIHPRTGTVDLPGGQINLFKRFRKLELSRDFLAFLKTTCENLGGRFFCSPFGLRSAADLLELGETAFKIASPELNHLPLISYLARRSEQLILSTGVSLLRDIEESLNCIRLSAQESRLPEITLLHCITSYPAPESEYNLRLIPNLSAVFGLPVGVSDHSLDPVLVPTLATLLGASFVEKHFTLSKDGTGLDDPIALTPADFAQMVNAIREAENLREHSGKAPETSRLLEIVTMHSLLKTHSKTDILNILGDGVKKLATSEQEHYGRSNRSIHIVKEQNAGHILTEADLAILRSEKNLRPGLHPRHFEQLIGATLIRPVREGDGILWEDVKVTG